MKAKAITDLKKIFQKKTCELEVEKQKHEALTDNTQLNPSSSALQLRSTTDSQMTTSDLKSLSPLETSELSDSPKIKIGK